ncbi:N-acetylglucosaminyl-diphospho-decaprenol L-rhamnosyltransferase [Barrientosiimonas humi]|uniref:N-acetylglucosaminyl-diphospho-decaprenol L-rhamnosyltransferase n=1 Tax=Barrientosiimonas humi TaxID=999931 RepID=A0A542XE11_9MICO|nr:N-acetylglucosaminyl-diphospho-decaprenol L-rhamnosyltransferase [Barrientosiimonas humi]CAG7574062.1 N-acetylglucosaminyl-diphospho-decaprenol L-rhamnosyltransferase [Barrientosiimonas humi]
MTNASVAVIIPHFGDPAPTQLLVRQLNDQRGSDCRVIVVDDASPVPFPSGEGFEVVRRQTNGGFGSAVNSGLAVVDEDAVLVLNSDVQVEPHFVSDLLAAADPWWPAVLSVQVRQQRDLCVTRLWPTPRQHVVEWLEPLARFHGRPWLERALGNDVAGWSSPSVAVTDWAVGVCLLMPTDDVQAVGGFDERFFMNSEEIDLQRRLHEERGLPVVVLPSPTLEHEGGGSSDPLRRAGWVVDSRFRYQQKWGSPTALRVGLMAASLVNLGWNGARRLAGRDVQPLSGFRSQRAVIQHGWATRREGESSAEVNANDA